MGLNRKYLSVIILIVVFSIFSIDAEAQCAMCRTTAESDLNNGGSVGKGLNNAIIYLMTIPYLVLMIGTYFFFKKPIDAKLKVIKAKLFHK